MNPYMDSIMENVGPYSVYGKDLGDKMRKDVEYGTNPWDRTGMAVTEAVGLGKDFEKRSAQIEMLNKQIAELEKQIKDYDMEEEMGKYKFLYDADPSTYTSYQQNKRSAAQTEAIRKANEDATKASNAQTAWRQLLIDEETEKYKKIDAEDKAKKALADGNMDEYKEAMKQVKRSEATLARYDRDKKQYRNKFNKMLGISEGEQEQTDETEEQTDETGAPGIYDEEKDPNIVTLKKYNKMINGIDQEITNLRKRVTSMTDKDKKAIIDNANKVLEDYRNSDVSFLNDAQKKAWTTKIAEFEDAIPTFKKSQPTNMTKEKYQTELDKLITKSQLVAKGYKWLKAAQQAGATHAYLQSAIDSAK